MEISSDEEHDAMLQTHADMMVVDDANDDDEIWVDPATVGLYCEPQVAMQCVIHAWHALLGRKAAPNYFYAALMSSNAPKEELAEFGTSGPYHPGGLILYALEHSTDNRKVTRAGFLNCGGTSPHYTMQQILEAAPDNCRGIIAHITLTPGI
jgi:hypothetical protein